MHSQRFKRSQNASLWYVRNAERIAFYILIMWCLLPVAMSGYDFFMCVLGKFPSDAAILAQGLKIGNLNYSIAIDTYYLMFRILGLVTLAYALFTIAACREKVFRRESIRSMPWFYLLLGLLGWSILSTLLSADPLYAFTGSSYIHDGLLSYFIYGSVFACASMIREEQHRLKLLRLFCSVIVYLSIIMIVQELTDNSFLRHCFSSPRAVVFNQFNHFGYVLCMGVMATMGLYLYDRLAGMALRGIYLAGFTILTYTLLVNNTFGAYLASLVALPIAYVFYHRASNRLNLAALLPGIVFLTLSVLNCLGLTPGAQTLLANLSQFGIDIKNIVTGMEEAAYAGTGRMTLWKDTIQRIGQRPIFGFGPEGFYGKNAITNYDSPHNEFLSIAGYNGIPALLFYLGALISLAHHQWKNIRRLSPMILAISGVTVGYLISSCFGNSFFNTAPFFWMYLGLTTADGETAPLLSLDHNIIGNYVTVNKKKGLLAFIVSGTLLLTCFWGAYMLFIHNTEKTNELNDLQCMRGAEITSRFYFSKNKLVSNTSYWYDPNHYALIPENEPKPLPYGYGTTLAGNTINAFNDEYDKHYIYDETTDYRRKIIKVNIGNITDRHFEMNMEWVEGIK